MNLLKKLMAFAMGNGIVFILGVISTPIITRIIDTDNMGKFSMFTTVVNLLLLVILLGIDQAYVRYYYDEAEETRGNFLRSCLKMPLMANLAVSIVLIIFYKPISVYLVKEESFLIIILLIVQLTANVISRFSMLEIRMKQKAKMYSFINIIMKFTYLISIAFMFIIFKNNYMTVLIATIISTLVMTAVSIYVERTLWFSKNKHLKVKTSNNELIRYGVPFIFSMAVTWMFQSIDKITIKAFYGYSEVGIYSGAIYIVALLSTLQEAFNTFWTPVSYERYTADPEDKEFFSRMNKVVSAAMLICAIGLITCKDIIILFLGEKYRSAVFIFPFLVFMPIMSCISETTVVGINFKKKTKNHVYIALTAAIFNLIGNLILVPSLGARGAAISTGLSYIVFFLARTFLSLKYYKVDYNLGRFCLCILSTYILAAYSSFNSFNLNICILAIIATTLVVISYKDVFKMAINGVKMIFSKKTLKK